MYGQEKKKKKDLFEDLMAEFLQISHDIVR